MDRSSRERTGHFLGKVGTIKPKGGGAGSWVSLPPGRLSNGEGSRDSFRGGWASPILELHTEHFPLVLSPADPAPAIPLAA